MLSYIVYDKGDSRHPIVYCWQAIVVGHPENTCKPEMADPDEAACRPTHVQHTQDGCIEAAASNRPEQILSSTASSGEASLAPPDLADSGRICCLLARTSRVVVTALGVGTPLAPAVLDTLPHVGRGYAKVPVCQGNVTRL